MFGRVLDAKTLIEALTALRVELHIPAGVPVASVFSPRAVHVHVHVHDHDYDSDAMIIDVHSRLLSAQRSVLTEAGFGAVRLDPVPVAFVRSPRTYVGNKEFCSGYGWRLGSSVDRLVVEQSPEMTERTLVADDISAWVVPTEELTPRL